MGKFELVEAKYIDMYHFQMIEGKFLDLEQKEYQHRKVYVYANLSNFESEIGNSDVRYYAHSFENLYCAEDYELYNFKAYDKEVKSELIKTDIYKEKFAEG